MTKKAFQLYSSRCCRSTNTCAEFKAISSSRLRSWPPRPLDKVFCARFPPPPHPPLSPPPPFLSLFKHTAQSPGQDLVLQNFFPLLFFSLFQTHLAAPCTRPAVPGYDDIFGTTNNTVFGIALDKALGARW